MSFMLKISDVHF